MKKQYVPKTLSEFLGESKSITLKRKYGQRATITAGTNAPLRNQVLSFVAESGSVSKRDLKQYILGLKEGGSTVAAANMFIKRNAKYFLMENKNGITYFKLSNLGQRLVNQFIPVENLNVSESVKIARDKLSSILERANRQKYLDEDIDIEETPEDEDVDDDMGEDDLEDDNVEAEDYTDDDLESDDEPAEKVDFDDDRFDEEPESGEEQHVESDEFEYAEDDEKITLTYYKNGKGGEEDLEDEEDLESDELEDEDVEDNYLEDDGTGEEELEDEDELAERPEDEEPREYDFKDKGRPGILGMDESAKVMRAQFVSHKLTGKKSPNLGGKLDSDLHNLLTDKQDKDESELKEANNLGKKLDPKLHNLLGDEDADDGELDNLENEITEARKDKMKKIIENLKAKRKKEKELFEATEPDESDELSDEDLKTLGAEEPEAGEEPVEDETATTLDGEENVEKVEITEFIITVDDVDSAIDELAELGITAERVPVEPKEEEIPAEVEEPEMPEEQPTDEAPVEEPTDEVPAEENNVKESLTEAEEQPEEELDLGTSDELGLGDQGEEAPELDQPEGEETLEPTAEFEENKIKVPADQWPTLKGWLEEKGVDVKEMFGGDIEMEEVSPEEAETEIGEEPVEEVPDEDIDFSGVGEEDETKIKEE